MLTHMENFYKITKLLDIVQVKRVLKKSLLVLIFDNFFQALNELNR